MADISKISVPIDGVQTVFNIKGSGGGGGSGLPDEVITYEQFRAKSDADQAAYTGYVTGWPGNGNIRYNPSTDYIQVYANGAWINCYYAGTQLDPTKMSLTQEEFIAICNQGLQSRMSIGAIITLNNQYCNQYEVIDVEHESTSNTVDIMAHTQVGNMAFGSSQNYNESSIRTWINSTYINAFDYDVRELMKTQQVTTMGTTQNDKAKLLSWIEIGLTNSNMDNTDGGTKYPVFTAGAFNTAILDRWRVAGNYGNSSNYWTRSRNTYYTGMAWYVSNSGYCDAMVCSNNNSGVLPVMRF